MPNNDFADILKSAFGDEEKPAAEEKDTTAEAATGTEAETPAAEAPAAEAPAADKKLPFATQSKGQGRLGGGKFIRPGATAKAPAAAAPGVAIATPPPPKAAPAAPIPAPAPAALALPGSTPLTPATGRTGGGPSTLLLVLLLVITFISLLISGAALAKISNLRKEMALLNAAMSRVEKSADRSWKIKCGIFSPVPNVRPQEYMIMYEEKDGKLIQEQLIIKPMEEK